MDRMFGDWQADRVVPPTGQTVWLTVFAAATMAYLAVFAMALALATGRLAATWEADLAQAVTIRITAPDAQADAQVAAVLTLLGTTEGVETARALDADDQKALLAPWLGTDLPLDRLPLPRLVEVVQDGDLDVEGLRLRLVAEVPGAVLDDHGRWREPLVRAAGGLRTLGWSALALIAATLAAVVTLAAQSALSANAQIIRVLRLIGAQDAYVARAFTRRFTLRAAAGAAFGTVAGLVTIAFLPEAETAGGFLTGLGYRGVGWLMPVLIPFFAGLMAFFATRRAAFRALVRFE
ncbi:cell division protein FtsX [Jannaschia pohangensis]|nr:cell division protein FtsX [Jannaschia pohangensis]